jgi:DNA (cytosine-5)-methyltransferase 1
MTNKEFTVASLFSGAGGLDLGFEWEGFNILWASDLNKDATDSYTRNFGRPAHQCDISDLSPADIPNADVIIGGPPCQSFSLVGQRKQDDPRGKLVFEFLRIVQEKQPRAFVMENVPGIAASTINGRRLPDVLVEKFSELGYFVEKFQLHALDYLVPQRRKRLVLVGCMTSRPVKPDGAEFAQECYQVSRDAFALGAKAALNDLGACVAKGMRATYKSVKPSTFARIMRRAGLDSVSLHECPRMSSTDMQIVQHIPPGGNYQDIPDSISTGRMMKFKETGGRTTTYGRLHPEQPSYTINTYFRRPNVGCNFHYAEPRLITPREAMRLQSMPDHWELVFSSQDARNALIGNAVPPLMGHAIAWSVGKSLAAPRQDNNQRMPLQLELLGSV